MLILMRRTGEKVLIGEDITIRVTKIRGTHVSLGVSCPTSVLVHRSEVYRRIYDEKARLQTAELGREDEDTKTGG